MLIKVTRFFISAAFGNVDPGTVLTVSDAQGKTLINAGLALLVSEAGPVLVHPEGNPSVFSRPVTKPVGLSSQAAPVSPDRIVKKLESGEKPKRKYTKSR